MAKQKKNVSFEMGVSGVMLLLGILVAVFLAVDAITYRVPLLGTIPVQGVDVAFGSDNSDPNFFAIAGYFLPLLGAALTFVGVLLAPKQKIYGFIGAGLTLVAIIFLFIVPSQFKLTAGPLSQTPKMAGGLLLAVICSIINLTGHVYLIFKNN